MPDVFLTRRQLVITAIESVYATDRAPQEANSYQPIRIIDPFTLDVGQEIVEVGGGFRSRGFSRPIATVRPVGITFRTYMQGLDSGSYTTNRKPPYGDMLRACGMIETFTSSTAAGIPQYRYAPAGDVGSDVSMTIVAHQDGYEHRILGARGNVNLVYVAAAPVIAEFNFRGILSTEASTTRSNPTGLVTGIPPRWVGSGSIFVQSLAAVVENLNFNTNNTLFEQRASVATSGSGILAVYITERAPGGSFDPEATEPTSHDFFGNWRATSGAVVRLQVGATQGNRFTFAGSQAIYKQLGWGDKQGLSIFNTNYQLYERSGDDEFELIFD